MLLLTIKQCQQMVTDMKKITLAMELFQEDRQTSLAFYCNVHGIKEGYMYIYLGTLQPEMAIWRGLGLVLERLTKTYREFSIQLAFSPLYMELGGGSGKNKVMALLKLFQNYEFIEYSSFNDSLRKINLMGSEDNHPANALKGYSMSEYEKRANSVPKTKKKYNINPIYYDGAFMPASGACLDLGTTSNVAKWARIIEFGVCKFADGVITDTLQSFVNPKIKVPKAVRELTGITQRDVDRAPFSYEAIKKLVEYLSDCKYLIGHNIQYDFTLIDTLCQRFRLPRLNVQLVCTKRLAKKANIIVKDYKLETLLELYGLTNERPHRALSDATATFHLLKKIYEESFIVS
jgi:DNA polymerase III epsilon subunit-like protein